MTLDYILSLIGRFQIIGESFELFPLGYTARIIDLETGKGVGRLKIGLVNSQIKFEWEEEEGLKELIEELNSRRLTVIGKSFFPLTFEIAVENLKTGDIEATLYLELRNNSWNISFTMS